MTAILSNLAIADDEEIDLSAEETSGPDRDRAAAPVPTGRLRFETGVISAMKLSGNLLSGYRTWHRSISPKRARKLNHEPAFWMMSTILSRCLTKRSAFSRTACGRLWMAT